MEVEQIVYSVVTVVAVGYLLLGRSRAEYSKGLKMAAWWVVILAAVTASVVYWEDFQNTKFYASIVPGSAVINADGSMEFARAADGHFYVRAKVNDVEIEFMVDTGASDIALTRADAKKIGLHPERLVFDKTYRTANGVTRGASVKLQNISVGSYQTGEIYASVNEGELDGSLLGLRFLNGLRSYRVEGEKLILTPR